MTIAGIDRAYLLLAFTTLCWAGNAVAGQLAVGHVSPLVLVCLRWTVVASLLVALHPRQLIASWPLVRRHWLAMTAMAGLGFTGFNALFYIASQATSGINIGILQGSIPVIVLLGSVAAFGTRIGLWQVAGVTVTLVGVIVVATKGELARLLALALNPGDLIMLFACLLYGGYTVALKRRPAIPGLIFFTWLSVVALLTSLPLLAIDVARGTALWPTPEGWAVTAYVALFPSCLAQIAFIRGVELIGPERAGIFVNLVPVFAALLSVVILHQPFMPFHAAALALVLGGIWIAERRKRPSA